MPGLQAHGLAVLLFTVAVFAAFTVRRIPLEVTSLSVLVALPLGFALFPYGSGSQAIEPREFFYGFAHEALVAICSLLVLGRALAETGALRPVTRRLVRLWRRRGAGAGLLVVLLASMVISSVVNSTPVVVLMIPVLIALARETGESSARMLMPMNFAVMIGGMSTVIGTSTNLLVTSIAARMDAAHFGIFDFTPIVAIAALAALPWLWFAAPRMLPAAHAETAPVERLFDAVLFVPDGSPAVGATLGDLLERSKRELRVKSVQRGENLSVVRLPNLQLAAGDRLLVTDTANRLKEFEEKLGLKLYNVDDPEHPVDEEHPLHHDDAVLAELILLPSSSLVGSTIREHRFIEHYDVAVLGAFRSTGSAMHRQRDVGDIRLAAGDVLLVQGTPEKLSSLRADQGVVVVDGTLESGPGGRGALAALIMAGVIGLAVFDVLPMYLSALTGVLALLVTRCVKPAAIGRALKTDVVLLVAASLALGKALVETGAAAALAQWLTTAVDGWPTIAVLGAMLVFVALLTNFVSDNAAGAIATPIAVETARSLGAPAEPFVLAILFGCNFNYATPIGYQTNLLVMSAARYRFIDFVKVGVPLLVLMVVVFTGLLGWWYSLW